MRTISRKRKFFAGSLFLLFLKPNEIEDVSPPAFFQQLLYGRKKKFRESDRKTTKENVQDHTSDMHSTHNSVRIYFIHTRPIQYFDKAKIKI